MTTVPRGARLLGALGRFLITTGVVVLLFVVFQLWGTNLQEARAQDGLRDDFDEIVTAARERLPALAAGTPETTAEALPTPTTTSTLPGGFDPEVLAFFFPEDGDAVARIEMPSIGVDKIVVNGVQVADLRKGPGHYPGTAAVGTSGNTSIAGHRTTYGAPFNRIDELRPGDEIHVTGVLGRFTYRVMAPETAYPERISTVQGSGAGHIIVVPTATWVLGDFDDNRLTLTACHPKLSSRQRIIVAAELVESPVAAPSFDPAVVAAFTGDAPREVELPGEAGPGETVPADPPATTTGPLADLDEGLSGERGAIPGAVVWMILATAIWVGAGFVGRRWFERTGQRVAVRLVGLVPTAVCLWFSFEMLDRALPAA